MCNKKEMLHKSEGFNMQVKTENNQICIYMSKTEANYLSEDLENIDTPNNGLISIQILKDVIEIGRYQDQ